MAVFLYLYYTSTKSTVFQEDNMCFTKRHVTEGIIMLINTPNSHHSLYACQWSQSPVLSPCSQLKAWRAIMRQRRPSVDTLTQLKNCVLGAGKNITTTCARWHHKNPPSQSQDPPYTGNQSCPYSIYNYILYPLTLCIRIELTLIQITQTGTV